MRVTFAELLASERHTHGNSSKGQRKLSLTEHEGEAHEPKGEDAQLENGVCSYRGRKARELEGMFHSPQQPNHRKYPKGAGG